MSSGAGLGSSAALSVCLSSAFLLYSKELMGTNTTLPHTTATDGNDNVVKTNGDCSYDKLDISSGDRNLICDWAFMSEKIIHGTPSGIDENDKR